MPGLGDGVAHNTRISAQPGRLALFDNMFTRSNFDFVGLNETKWKGTNDLVMKDNYAFLLPHTLGAQGVGIAIKLKLYFTTLKIIQYFNKPILILLILSNSYTVIVLSGIKTIVVVTMIPTSDIFYY